MIRARTSSGKVAALPEDTRFLEIMSADQKVAAAVWIDEGDVVHVAQPGDKDFDRYLNAFGLTAAKVVDLAKASAAG